MNTLLTILGIVILVAFLAGLFYVLFKIQLAMCEDCPLKDKCFSEHLDISDDEMPPCMKRFHSPDNNLFN